MGASCHDHMLGRPGEDLAKTYRACTAQGESEELTTILSGRNLPSVIGTDEGEGGSHRAQPFMTQ